MTALLIIADQQSIYAQQHEQNLRLMQVASKQQPQQLGTDNATTELISAAQVLDRTCDH